MADLSPSAITRKARTKGGVVTIVTVLSLVAAMGLTWFGLSVNDHVSANYDASSWLWSMTRGELARVNGLTGKVDTRQAVTTSQGHLMEVSQSDRYLILRDQSTGVISALDPATLQITSTQESQQGAGVTIALHNDAAFIIDPVQGVVRQLDPTTLQPIGEPLRYPPGITGGAFDGTGRLWIAVPSQGTVSAITPAPRISASGGTGGGGPSLIRTEPVAESSHDLSISGLDNGVAVLDQTNGTLTTLRGDNLTKVTVSQAAGGDLASRSGGADVPVTVSEGRHVYVVNGEKVRDFVVPGAGSQLSPAVSWAGRIYVADNATGVVYVIDDKGQVVRTIEFKNPGGPLELEVRENHLFINAPGSATARVVDDKHEVKVVDKFATDIVGADPPPDVPPPPPPAPVVGPPSAPRNVTAAAGNAQVRLSWGKATPNGAKVTKYVVSGSGKTWEVGANQRSLIIPGLVNGQVYTFAVKAVNAKGAGPERKSNSVMPTGDVPDAPTGLNAAERPDGTVVVKWTAANGQGRKIIRYEVTAVSAGASAPIGTTTGATSLTIADGDLDYGTQYAFSVVAVNDKGAGSEPSQLSGTVVPFTKPDVVKNLSAATASGAKGTITVDWAAPAENGRPITGYRVTAKGNTQTVTATKATLNGFADGEIVTVTVAAVNEAGSGATATTSAKTISAPSVSGVSTSGVGYNDMVVRFAYNDGGGSATCTLTLNGARRTIGCNSGAGGYTVNGLWPNQVYNYTVTVANAAGNATSGQQSVRTPTLYGWVRCVSSDGYCSSGISTYTITSQHSSNWVRERPNSSGTRIVAICKAAGMNPPKAGSANNSATLRAVQYNSSKQSSWWVKIGGNEYVPYIWFNLESYGNASTGNIGLLPDC
jgi:hypothetical protein